MLEIIAVTLEDAKLINESGAGRIELVSSLSEGGLTPSYGLIKAVVDLVDIPVNVMIRPHSQGFVYTDDEINMMIEDIKITKSLGVNGVVFGVLDNDNKIDEKKLQLLLEASDNLDVAFHRAIDECENILIEVKKLSKYKSITHVLTSGGPGKVEDHLHVLKEMNKYVRVLVGSGINVNNSKYIMDNTDIEEIHVGTSIRNDNSFFCNINKDKLLDFVKSYNQNRGGLK